MEVLQAFGLSSAIGFKPYFPLIIISILYRSNIIHLKALENIFSSNIFLIGIIILAILDFFSEMVPFIGRVLNFINFPIVFLCGFLTSVAILGNNEGENMVRMLVIGFSGGSISFGLKFLKTILDASKEVITAGLTAPIISIENSIVSIMSSLLASIFPILAAVLMVIIILVLLYIFSKIKKMKRKVYNFKNI